MRILVTARPQRMFTNVAVPPVAGDLLRLAQDWHPDVVVHEEGVYAAPLVATLLGIPCVTHSWPSPARPAAGRGPMAEPLGEVWKQLGAAGAASQSG